VPAGISTVRSDFDRIAALPERYAWSPNDFYHPYLLKRLPPYCGHALEIGCGTGAFARCLANRSGKVTGLDLSPEMVRLACLRSADYHNIDFQVADVAEWAFPPSAFDCIASIATLHHLPLATMLLKMRESLNPGGTLLVLDLWRAQGAGDILVSLVTAPLNFVLRAVHNRRLFMPRDVREAWDEHGRNDVYMTVREVRSICAAILPGATVKKHLLWRYSIVWRKPRR
jgi:2-polyprenyl-3-methyl-5-hydroxy-6-metoxy-1,4-benzoquinol methylase